MKGFIGPKDIFRNPEAIFRYFKPTQSHAESPFDIVLTDKGRDFAVMDMHFKLGLYEHQSASAIEGILQLIHKDPKGILGEGNYENIERIKVTAYEPAFGIIGDPAKRNPKTRQSADHSMVYILATILRKALSKHDSIVEHQKENHEGIDKLWKSLMLSPNDYGEDAITNTITRKLMEKISFEHGGPEYDSKYPEGIPTSVQIVTKTSLGE